MTNNSSLLLFVTSFCDDLLSAFTVKIGKCLLNLMGNLNLFLLMAEEILITQLSLITVILNCQRLHRGQ